MATSVSGVGGGDRRDKTQCYRTHEGGGGGGGVGGVQGVSGSVTSAQARHPCCSLNHAVPPPPHPFYPVHPHPAPWSDARAH